MILDFDGTFTLVDEESGPFLAAFREELGRTLNRDIGEFWDKAEEKVRSEPLSHGWREGGKLVAPAYSDPYLLASATGHVVLKELTSLSPQERTTELSRLYGTCYPLANTVFRPEAKAVLEELLATEAHVHVVTNSATDHVKAKLEKLNPSGMDRMSVRGDARKFELAPPTERHPWFDQVPERLDIEGFGRPIYPRRGRYFDALVAIWNETGTTPIETLVCGDIFELDLALPAQLGARVQLVTRPQTPATEVLAVEQASGRASSALNDLFATFYDE